MLEYMKIDTVGKGCNKLLIEEEGVAVDMPRKAAVAEFSNISGHRNSSIKQEW